MIFERIVCGVDASPASLEAVRQAERLLEPGGRLLLVGVADVSIAAGAGWAGTAVAVEIVTGERTALAAARAALVNPDRAEELMIEGEPVRALLATLKKERATALAVGTHGRSRAAGLVLGSVTTALLHEAPSSVLVARAARGRERFPESIAVGVDGSHEARAALDAARELSGRFHTHLRVIAATGGRPVDIEGLRGIGVIEWDARRPVDALVGASAEADLLVVGSRGLHGVAALGSVSERVAHGAACTVLVVREERR